MKPGAEVWKDDVLVRTYLEGVRGGIPLAAEQLDAMLRVVAARDEPVRRFLDVGSGAGVVAAAVLSRFPEARAVLVDFSASMLDAARARFGSDQHRLVLADVGQQEWTAEVMGEAPFDAVVSGYAIHHLPDDRKRTLYGEIYGLLSPGGVFVNIEHVLPATPWVGGINDTLFIDSLDAHHQRLGGAKTRQEVADKYFFRPDKAANILAPVELQCAWLREIGFADVDCYFKIFELAVFGGQKPAG
ncbi:MAG: class I SAM-dependent methyltransferase [Thermomicrobiales bacterium]